MADNEARITINPDCNPTVNAGRTELREGECWCMYGPTEHVLGLAALILKEAISTKTMVLLWPLSSEMLSLDVRPGSPEDMAWVYGLPNEMGGWDIAMWATVTR